MFESIKKFRMPCEETMGAYLAKSGNHMSLDSIIDPKRHVWKTGCYIPDKTTSFWNFGAT